MDLQPGPGLVLGGTYRIERLIGEGGMGSVYEASHLRLPRRFAVKLIHSHIASRPEIFERFRREAEIASGIGHEHIVEAFDFNHTEEGVAYIVMELLEGEHLRSRLDANRTLSLEQTVDIIDQIADAVAAAHARGIVHRDLKPENIFLCRRHGRDFVKVLDFGVSKLLHAATISGQTGHPIGTPHYMAPEQASASVGPIDERSDVFALGAITYECLTGTFAFEAPTPLGVMHAVLHATPPPLCSRRPDVPSAVQAVTDRAMAKKPDDRYRNVGSFRAELLAASGMSTTETLSSARVPDAPQLASGSSGREVRVEIAHRSMRPSADAETLVATHRSSSPRRDGPRTRRKRAMLYSGAALLVAAAALIALSRTRSKHEEPRSRAFADSSSPAASTDTSQATAATRAAPIERSVEIQLRIEPPDARVMLDGVETKQNPLQLPYSDRAHKVVVSAAGFVAENREIFGITDGELRVELKPDHSAAPRRGTGSPRRSVEPPAPAPAQPASSLGPVERSL
ncbi:MAG TPA: serine/threonine-protein kinase [Polyangiaceae bacterium]